MLTKQQKKKKKKEAWRELYKNVTSYIEQIQEATSYEMTAVRPLISYLESHPSKMKEICGTLLEKQGETHKWRSLMDPYT